MADGRGAAPAAERVKVVSLAPLWHDELAAKLLAGIVFVDVDASRAAREVADAEVLLTTRFDAPLAATCEKLELLVCPAAGTEGIDRALLPPAVRVVNGSGHEIPVAEHVIGALVALRKHFRESEAALRRGLWRFGYFGSGEMVGELHGSALGFVGFGRIGIETARRAAAFGMRCRAVTMHPDKRVEHGLLERTLGDLANADDVDDLLAHADAVVIACELSPLTHGLIDARRLALMRSSAVLVNVARGPVVEERALYDALKAKAIAGAAIDVWYRYPDEGSDTARPSACQFEELENVLMTPHSSGWTLAAKERKLDMLARVINEHYASRRI